MNRIRGLWSLWGISRFRFFERVVKGKGVRIRVLNVEIGGLLDSTLWRMHFHVKVMYGHNSTHRENRGFSECYVLISEMWGTK